MDIVPSDFNKYITSWIGGNVAPTEIKNRLDTARQWATSVDPNIKKALKDFYGVDESGIALYALAPDITEQELIKRNKIVNIAAEARGQTLDITKDLATSLVDKGIENQQARQAFGQVAKEKETYGVLSGIEGTNLTQSDLIKSELGVDAEAAKKAKTLRSKEESRFSGLGAGTNILGGNVSGSF